MTKEDQLTSISLSLATIDKVGKNGRVTTAVLGRICEAMSVNINDIREVAKRPAKMIRDDLEYSLNTKPNTFEVEQVRAALPEYFA